ncbi:hypothetical protein Pan54_47980 [Rubinisphaera italica]|uniref:Uncharacterized protein n=1 Tax=Rubinisphaera italica TaxID=2527969 RepID=A0A5C5XMV4_9PLAN|nr:hypothetical protein Pan54_47980 [Rubinisphaera italica]
MLISVRIGLVLLVVGCATSVAYSQCGSAYRNYGYHQPSNGYWFPRSAMMPQSYYYQPRYFGQPQFPVSSPCHGVRPGNAPQQGSAMRSYNGPQTIGQQPAPSINPTSPTPEPSYSAPQGSGSRSTPSQGSGSR